ncbi:hypothetical protein D3C81_1207400 [compost metagenome]
MGETENQRAQHGEQQHRCLHAARTVAVEHDTERNLRRSEGQKIHAGQETQAAGGQVQFPFQVHINQGIDRAKQVRHKMAEAKRDEYGQEQVQKRVLDFLVGLGARACILITHVEASHVEKVVRISQQKRPRTSSSQSSSGHGRISENFT